LFDVQCRSFLPSPPYHCYAISTINQAHRSLVHIFSPLSLHLHQHLNHPVGGAGLPPHHHSLQSPSHPTIFYSFFFHLSHALSLARNAPKPRRQCHQSSRSRSHCPLSLSSSSNPPTNHQLRSSSPPPSTRTRSHTYTHTPTQATPTPTPIPTTTTTATAARYAPTAPAGP